MEFGYNFSSNWQHDPFNYKEEEVLKLLSKVDMDCLEIQLAVVKIMDKHGNLIQKNKKSFFRLLKKYNIKVGSVHGPYPYYTHVYLDFIKGKLFRESINSIKNTIKIANELNAKTMVLHPVHSMGFHRDAVRYEKRITERIIKNLAIVRDYIEKNKFDITIGLETMEPDYEGRVVVCDKPQEMVNIIKALDSDRIKVTWDMCHTYRSIVRYNIKLKDLKEIAKNTCHIHYSSFSSTIGECHVPTNFGEKEPIHKMVALLDNFDGIVINEISPKVLCRFDPKIKMVDWLKIVLEQSRKDFKKWMH